MKKRLAIRKHSSARVNLLRRARRLMSRSFGRIKSSNKTISSQLSYGTNGSVNVMEKLQKEEHFDRMKFKEKLGFKYDTNMDYKYRSNLTYYDNQMMNSQAIRFLILDKNQNIIRK